MNQTQFDQLIMDIFELHEYGDMSEMADFLVGLQDKYSLTFQSYTFSNSANSTEYFSRT